MAGVGSDDEQEAEGATERLTKRIPFHDVRRDTDVSFFKCMSLKEQISQLSPN